MSKHDVTRGKISMQVLYSLLFSSLLSSSSLTSSDRSGIEERQWCANHFLKQLIMKDLRREENCNIRGRQHTKEKKERARHGKRMRTGKERKKRKKKKRDNEKSERQSVKKKEKKKREREPVQLSVPQRRK